MANFTPPFGENGERRPPTARSRCGVPLRSCSQSPLHRYCWNRLEAEVGQSRGLRRYLPANRRYTQLREAIESLIMAATGRGIPPTSCS